ncbi:lymphocyte activation gene 3 protein [Leptodactylus fuscus]|uniref:lymphocyte activation gene 3 protein n=1 Tax=Leptodactylus fuscus TaxID=238119 RepID=UPI003F4F094F
MYVRPVCLLLLCAIIPVSAVYVTGVVGGHVILPCTMRKDFVEAERKTTYPRSWVHWRRIDGFTRTVHMLPSSGISYTSLQVKSRASVQSILVDHGVFSLHLKNLKEQDAGSYYAVAKYGKRKRECAVTLRTLQVTHLPHGPLPENSSVILTCSFVDPARSSPSFRWLHRDNLVRPSSRISVNGSNLYLHSLTQDDHGKWSCEVDGTRSSLTLSVVGIAGPDPFPVYTAIGSAVELPCNFTHLPVERRLTFHWSKDKKIIHDNKQILVLHHVGLEDAGIYQCQTTYKSQRLTRRIDLRVIQVSPSSPVFAREGSHLQLLCNINGSSGKERFQWTSPPLAEGLRKVIKGAVVDLSDVQTQDSGAWTCSVYGMNGTLGEVQHWVYVHAAQTADIGSFNSWHVVLLLMLILVLCLAAIAFISYRNHKRRLSHLTALISKELPPVSEPKKMSTSE